MLPCFALFLTPQRSPGRKLFCGSAMVNPRLRFLFRLLLSGCCALIPGTLHAQLNDRPYQQWTAKEAKGLLVNSPWAQTLLGLIPVERSDPSTAIADSAITLRLHSALPLRQALARLRQLRDKYDQKGDSDRAATDAKNKTLLECPDCRDCYVVTISPGPDSTNELPMFLDRMTLARLKLNVHIRNEKGETRELVKFVNPRFNGGDAMFFFSRLNSKGEPLISPSNRTLTISFDQIFGWVPATITKFEFDVGKMIVNGQVVF
jgi:hypothetical protein